MSTSSTRTRTAGKADLRLISACAAGLIVLGAIWWLPDDLGHNKSDSGETSHSLDTAAPDPELALSLSGDAGTARAGLSSEEGSDGVPPDDDIDVALGGSWENYDCALVTTQVVVRSTGETVEALACERSADKPIHPYESYSDEALQSLAYADPVAAIILGRRVALAHPDEAWEHMIRSSAMLGGDPRPIKWLATNSFNRVSSDGEIAVNEMQIRYVLDALTRRLENSPNESSTFRDDYLRNTLSETDLAQLDRTVENLIRKMQTIEEETTGNSTITGATNEKGFLLDRQGDFPDSGFIDFQHCAGPGSHSNSLPGVS